MPYVMDINPVVEMGNNHQLTHPKFQMEQPQSKQSHNMVNMQQVPDMGIPQPQTPMGQTQQPQHWAANIPSQSNGDDFDSNMYAILYNMNGYIAPHQDQYSYSDQQIMHSQLYHAQQPFSQQPAFLQSQSSISQYPPLPDKIPEKCLEEESATASDLLISTASSSTLPVAQTVATSPAQEATSSSIDSEMPAPRSRSKKTHNEHERVYRNKLNASLLLLGNALEGKSDNDKSKHTELKSVGPKVIVVNKAVEMLKRYHFLESENQNLRATIGILQNQLQQGQQTQGQLIPGQMMQGRL